jgi:hypothetical protein
VKAIFFQLEINLFKHRQQFFKFATKRLTRRALPAAVASCVAMSKKLSGWPS